MQRTVVIHCHIYKNAGATFDWSLQRSFGSAFLSHRDNKKMQQGSAYLKKLIQNNDDLKAVSSHNIRLPLPEIKDTRILPAIILRHPVDRAGAIYLYDSRHQLKNSDKNKVSFQEYVLKQMNTSEGNKTGNFQTRFCIDTSAKIITEKDFFTALKWISSTPLLGLTDCYDESMVLFEDSLRPYFPDIDLSYTREHLAFVQEKNVELRIKNIYDALGTKAIDMIYAGNHWDLLLYLETGKILSERIEKTPLFSDKLNDFYKRCLSLRNINIRE